MCNYCQTGTIFGNTNCYNTSWQVQRVWCDGCGNVHVVLSSNTQCHRQTCGTYNCCQGVGVTNDTPTTTTGNVCRRCCGGTATQGNTTTSNLMTVQDCELYYARQYGLYPYNRATCGCGFIGTTAQ